VIGNEPKKHCPRLISRPKFLGSGVPVPPDQQLFLDTVQILYWKGKGRYPSATVRMDFRGPVVGDFIYNCRILGHEDNEMMATIGVLAKDDLSSQDDAKNWRVFHSP
jgi:FtsP/CotA-like multicopper oxidase with cupredoxin domain